MLPVGAPTFATALQMGTEVYHALHRVLHKRGLGTSVGDEGGFAPSLPNNRAPLDLIIEAIETAGYKPGDDVALALDVAATELYQDGVYVLEREGATQDRRPRWSPTTRACVDVVPDRLDRGRPGRGRLGRLEAADRAPRRAGPAGRRRSVRDQRRAAAARHRRGHRELDPGQGEPDRHRHRDARGGRAWRTRPASRRSCRTARARPRTRPSPTSRSAPDVGQIKTGAPARSERVAKYNQLLRIEEELGLAAVYAGRAPFADIG